MAAADEKEHLLGGKPSLQEAASKAWLAARRAACVPSYKKRIKAGEEGPYYKEIDLRAAAAAAEEDEKDRLQAAKFAAGFIIHFPGDGLEEETKRADAKLLQRSAARPLPAPPRRRSCLSTLFDYFSTKFPRPEPAPIRPGEPIDFIQLQHFQEQRRRATEPGHFEQLAMDRELIMDCLRHYNSRHPGDEYKPAPGQVTEQWHFHSGTCWIHGNFVARRKCSGCFFFLPAPRTLFFYELALGDSFHGVVTCTPLLDEPVTEAYSVLGFPLWWSTRRNGGLDCICKTCSRRLDVWRPDLKRTLACGHKEVAKVCEMCYCCSDVLHPSPGEFAFGYHAPYHSYPEH